MEDKWQGMRLEKGEEEAGIRRGKEEKKRQGDEAREGRRNETER